MSAFSHRTYRIATRFAIAAMIGVLFASCTKSSNPASDQGALSDPSIKPTVIFTLPGNNSVGPFEIYNQGDGSSRPSFVVQFNKLMSTYSFVSSSIKCTGFPRPVTVVLHQYYPIIIYDKSAKDDPVSSVAPAVAVGKENARIHPDKPAAYSSVLEFDIKDSTTGQQMRYSVGQKYRITIDTTMRDINGNYLQYPYSFEFTPEPDFRVITTTPRDGENNVNPAQGINISVVFNSPLKSSSLPGIAISPPLIGTWSFAYDSTIVYFISSGKYQFNQTYTIKIPTGTADNYGHQLTSDYTASFKTLPFQISSVNPNDGATGVSSNAWIYFQTTGLYDTASVPSSFSISPDVSGSFQYSLEYTPYFTFMPANGFAFNTQYTVTISTGFKSAGGIHISAPFVTRFTTQPFQVSSTSPPNGTTNIPPGSVTSIYVYFDGAIDGSSAQQAFSINPNVAGQILTNGQNVLVFTPSSGFAAATTYTVNISAAMKSMNGTSLSSPYQFSFSTAP